MITNYKILLKLFLAAVVLSIFIHTKLSPFEMLWSFSIWLEALAVLP